MDRASFHDNCSLVDDLKRRSVFRDGRVEAAMKALDRANFTPVKQMAYWDRPAPIGYGATISAPHMHAHCLQLLSSHLRPGTRALDVGSGSGYLTAAMGRMVSEAGPGDVPGSVVGVDHIPELVQDSEENCRKDPVAQKLLESGIIRFVVGDGHLGFEAGGPYDAIHVGAAAGKLPQALLDQLARGGRLVLPVGGRGLDQVMVVVDKDDAGALTKRELFGVMYVPLTTPDRQLEDAG